MPPRSSHPRWSSRSPATVSRPPADGLDPLRPQAASGSSTGAAPEREALARAAYGRTASAEDEARAAEAARALRDLDLREAAERQALHRATLDEAAARERRAHRIRSRAARVLGTLAVLGVIAAGAATLLAPPESHDGGQSATPSARALVATDSAPNTSSALSGGAANAQFWFDEPQVDSDRTPSTLGGIDPDSTRSVASDVEGWQLWVAKDVDGNLCLVVHETETGINAWSCATPERFTASGVLITAKGTTSITASWDGFDVHSEP